MKVFKTKSLISSVTDEQLKQSVKRTAFISFERAIIEIEEYHGMNRKIIGYEVTEQGIILILE